MIPKKSQLSKFSTAARPSNHATAAEVSTHIAIGRPTCLQTNEAVEAARPNLMERDTL
jgi:hypothetical protein